MRYLVVDYSDGTIAIVYPVPRAKLSLFDDLIRRLQQRWLEFQCDTHELMASERFQADWQIVEAIASFLPSEPSLPLKLELIREDVELFQRLFLGVVNGEEYTIAQLIDLHKFEPRERKPRGEDDPITISDIPFPSCGDYDDDALANLINAYQEFGWFLFHNVDAERLDKMMGVLAELGRPPDERVAEYIGQLAQKWKQGNQEYNRSLYEDW